MSPAPSWPRSPTALQRRGVEVRVVAPSDAGRVRRATNSTGIPVRRVRYASAAERDPGVPGHDDRRGPGCRAACARWPDSGVRLRGAAQEEVAAGAQVIHAHWWVPARPGRAARHAAGAHGSWHRRRASCSAPGWRARWHGRCSGVRASSRPSRTPARTIIARVDRPVHRAGAHAADAGATGRRALEHRRGGAHRRFAAHRAEAGAPRARGGGLPARSRRAAAAHHRR